MLKADDEIFMEQNTLSFYETIDYEEIRKCFDLDCVNIEYPISIVSTGLKDILIPIKNENILNKLNPNLDEITKIRKKIDYWNMHTFSNITIPPNKITLFKLNDSYNCLDILL